MGRSRSDATGSVAVFKPDEISKGVTTSPQDMMNGKIAGVSISNSQEECLVEELLSVWRFFFECK